MQKKTYLCPYCFTEHKRKSLCYRCVNVRCEKKPDLPYARYCCKAPELKQACFMGKGRRFYQRVTEAPCPDCYSISNEIICPTCHNTLPPWGRNHETIMISVVGAMDAGKSSYLAVLLHEFKRKLAFLLDSAASFLDEASVREYEDRFLQYLYPWIGTNPSSRLPKTKSVLCGSEYISPNRPILMNYRKVKKEKGRQKEKLTTFIFYDEAGEDFEEETVMFTVSKQLSESDAILFFVDPLKIPFVRSLLPEEALKGGMTKKADSSSDADVILLRLAKLLRAKEKLKEEERIDIPLAVIVPKLDLITPLLPSNSLLLREGMHLKEKAYVCQEGFDIHGEVSGLLYEWGEQEFLSHLEANFTHYQLFSVSSFGNNPDEFGRFFLPRPVRVEDPFLWVLKEKDLIRSI